MQTWANCRLASSATDAVTLYSIYVHIVSITLLVVAHHRQEITFSLTSLVTFKFPDFSPTTFKFHDISTFSGWWPHGHPVGCLKEPSVLAHITQLLPLLQATWSESNALINDTVVTYRQRCSAPRLIRHDNSRVYRTALKLAGKYLGHDTWTRSRCGTSTNLTNNINRSSHAETQHIISC